MKEVKIKYFTSDYPELKKLPDGDWIDLRVNSIKKYSVKKLEALQQTNFIMSGELKYCKGDIIKFGLGVAMELPDGYEALVVPRSSTFKKWGFIQTNSPGVIDTSYCGNHDEWQVEFIATRGGSINRLDRVCQFRIQENQPKIKFIKTVELTEPSRSGYGSTGHE